MTDASGLYAAGASLFSGRCLRSYVWTHGTQARTLMCADVRMGREFSGKFAAPNPM